MKKTLVLLLVFAMVLSLAACGGNNNNNNAADNKAGSGNDAATNAGDEQPSTNPEEKVKLRIYAQYADEDMKTPYDYAVAELKKEMPNVELELEIQAQDDGQKLKTMAATGNLPDIYQAGLDQINTFKESGNILMLDDYLDTYDFKSKMHASTMNTLYAEDGHAYAFPYAGNELVLLFYNKEIFEKHGVKVPTTYDELLTAIEVFNKNDIAPLALFAKEKWPTVALYDMIATRYDNAGIKKLGNGSVKASDEAYATAAKKLEELVKAGLLPKGATSMNYDQARALFYEGKAAMFLNGQWEIEGSTAALGDKVDWMYYPAPDAASYEANKLAFSGGGAPGGYAVNPNSKHVDLAVKVAAFISLKYAEYKYTNRGTPIVATKTDLPIVKPFPPMMEKLAQDIPNMTSTTIFAWSVPVPQIKAMLEDSSQNMMTGSYSAEMFMQDVDSAIEQASK